MKTFTVYPAIDLRNGKVVRLEYGDPDRQTTFGDDPAAMGHRWQQAGASWLHVVNLDGAFNEPGLANWKALQEICTVGLPVQFGGGLRSLTSIENALTAGASRAILGTIAIEEPDLVARAVTEFGGERIVVGIDARDDEVKTHGWQKGTGRSPSALGQQMVDLGVQTFIHTDISRDGVYAGVNRTASAELAQAIGVEVIASGGVSSLQDIEDVAKLAWQGVSGVVVGRSLYDNRVNLAEALRLVAAMKGNS